MYLPLYSVIFKNKRTNQKDTVPIHWYQTFIYFITVLFKTDNFLRAINVICIICVIQCLLSRKRVSGGPACTSQTIYFSNSEHYPKGHRSCACVNNKDDIQIIDKKLFFLRQMTNDIVLYSKPNIFSGLEDRDGTSQNIVPVLGMITTV